VQNLLGTVLITEHLKGANDLAKRLGHRYRIVTLEGDVVNPGGSMTGGAVKKKSSSLLGRNRELEAQTKRLAEMEEKTELLEKEVKALKQTIQELDAKTVTSRGRGRLKIRAAGNQRPSVRTRNRREKRQQPFGAL
jgi:chromosome segregation protein